MTLSHLPVPCPMENLMVQTWREPVLSLTPSATQQWLRESFFLQHFPREWHTTLATRGSARGKVPLHPAFKTTDQPEGSNQSPEELQSWQGLKSSQRLLRTSLAWSSKAQCGHTAAEAAPMYHGSPWRQQLSEVGRGGFIAPEGPRELEVGDAVSSFLMCALAQCRKKAHTGTEEKKTSFAQVCTCWKSKKYCRRKRATLEIQKRLQSIG